MRPRGASAVPDVADYLAAEHRLARDNCKAGHMPIDGLDAVAMVDHHLAAISAGHLGLLYYAVASGADGNAVGGGDVDSGVELALAVPQNRVLTLTKATGDRPHDGPQRRDERCKVPAAETTAEEIGRGVARSAEVGDRPNHCAAHC